MNRQDYNLLRTEVLSVAQNISDQKGGEYNGDADILKSLHQAGIRTQLPVESLLFVYLDKHLCAIRSALANPNTPLSESMESRIADAINFLLLLYAVYVSRQKQDFITYREN